MRKVKKLVKVIKMCDSAFLFYFFLHISFSVLSTLVQLYIPKVIIAGIMSSGFRMLLLIPVFVFFLLDSFKLWADRKISDKREIINKRCEGLLTDQLMRVPYSSLEDQEFMDIKAGAFYTIRNYRTLDSMTEVLGNFVISLIIVAFSAGWLVRINISLLAIVVLGVVLQTLLSRSLNFRLSTYFKNLYGLNRKFDWFTAVKGDLSIQKDARVFQTKSMISNKMFEYCKNTADTFLEMNDITANNRVKVSFINVAVLGLGYLITGLQVLGKLGDKLAIGDFIFLNTMIAKLSTLLFGLGGHVTALAQLMDYLEPVFKILDYETEDSWGQEHLNEIRSIEFRSVYFRYPNSVEWALQDISFLIGPGERIGLVGLNGAGKTTLIKLLCGLYKPTTGEIIFNGKNIRHYTCESIMCQIGAVFQDSNLFNFSIRENITSGQGPDNKSFCRVTDLLGLKEIYSLFKERENSLLGTQLEDEAVDLSGGQLQKITIARALYKDASLLIFDEPNSKLDPIAEYNTYKMYSDIIGDRITIFISHRMVATKFCDKILVLQNGKFEDFDTHNTLMRRKGSLYQEVFTMQQQEYETQNY